MQKLLLREFQQARAAEAVGVEAAEELALGIAQHDTCTLTAFGMVGLAKERPAATGTGLGHGLRG